MSKRKFKVGDKVRVLVNSCGYKKNDEGVVVVLSGDTSCPVTVFVEGRNSTSWSAPSVAFYRDELELIEEHPQKSPLLSTIDTIKDLKGLSSITVENNTITAVFEPDIEVEEGKVYYSEFKGNTTPCIFRAKKIESDNVLDFSVCFIDGDTYIDGQLCLLEYIKLLRPATPAECAKLVKAEIENGWFWNGKELVKL